MSLTASLVGTRIEGLSPGVAVEWPGGRIGGPSAAVRLKLRHADLLAQLAQGRIGELADAYVDGRLDIEGTMPDVMAVAGALAGDPLHAARAPLWPRRLSRLASLWGHRPEQDLHHVQRHYDVGDDFYRLWLDPRMVYSCAYYARPGIGLAEAQEAKLDLICRKLQLAPGLRLLDVGMGWGGLLLWAASRYGVRATGITLSQNQYLHVKRRVADAGLNDQVQVLLMDYRELPARTPVDGRYDRIASVGMFEHVGRARLADYFRCTQRLLRPGGLLLNHGIAAGAPQHDQMGAGMGAFIEKHIFPGGELVHVSEATQALARGGLELVDAENLRPHYARTLWHWSDQLEARLTHARSVATEATVRAYRLYLAGSAMCFERGWLALYQLLATWPQSEDRAADSGSTGSGGGGGGHWAARSDYPYTRAHMYR